MNLSHNTNGAIPLLEPPPNNVNKGKKVINISSNSLNDLYANTQDGIKNTNALNDTTNVINRIWHETLVGNGNSIDSTRNSISNTSVRSVQSNLIKLDDLRVSKNKRTTHNVY